MTDSAIPTLDREPSSAPGQPVRVLIDAPPSKARKDRLRKRGRLIQIEAEIRDAETNALILRDVIREIDAEIARRNMLVVERRHATADDTA